MHEQTYDDRLNHGVMELVRIVRDDDAYNSSAGASSIVADRSRSARVRRLSDAVAARWDVAVKDLATRVIELHGNPTREEAREAVMREAREARMDREAEASRNKVDRAASGLK